MYRLYRYGFLLAAGYLMLAFMGCAEAPVQQVTDLYWPPPPDQPRIKFLESWHKQDDFGKEAMAAFMEKFIGEESQAALIKPQAVAADSSGRIYVTDTALGAVIVIDKVAKKFWFMGTGGLGKLAVPVGIAIHEEGNRIYVSDSKTDMINVYKMNGSFDMVIGGMVEKTFENPAGIAIDKNLKRLYIADTKKHKIFVYSLDGKPLSEFGDRGTDDGKLNFPTYLAVNSKGNIYVVDSGNFRVQAFTPEGKFLTKWGQVGDNMGSFARPKALAIDSEDHVYVTDAAFNNFQIFDADGRLLMWVGNGGFGPGQFQIASGISIDSQDRIYVADQLNRRVQVFQYLGGRYSGPDRVPAELSPAGEVKKTAVK